MTFKLPRPTRPLRRSRTAIALCVAAFAPLAFAQPRPPAPAAPPAVAEDPAVRYARLVEEANLLRGDTALRQQLLASQRDRLAALEAQSASLDVTAAGIEELVMRMFTELEAFIAADLPFHLERRNESLARLRDVILPSTERTVSEKMRRVLEQYTLELDYGRTMEAYEGTVDGRTADLVRLGRVALLYRTEDGEVGYWDRNQRAWVQNPDYTRRIEAALRVAKEESAPDLIIVPVPAPQETRL